MKNNTSQMKKGFTLVEILVTIAVSGLLFAAISDLMIRFTQTNTQIKNDMLNNDEKEIVYQMIRNAVDEGDRIVYQENLFPPSDYLQSFVLLNRKESERLPFTIVTVRDSGEKYGEALGTSIGATIYNLSIRNVAYVENGSAWTFSGSLLPREESGYKLDFVHNRVTIGDPPDETTYCQSGVSTECILAGYEQHQLAVGTTAYAPFISITKPTDLKKVGNNLYVLSPYENREYRIDLSDYTITTTTNTSGTKFPYYYDTSGNIVDLMESAATAGKVWELNTNVHLPTQSFPTDTLNSFGITKLQLAKDVYLSTGSPYQMSRIYFEVVNPIFTSEGKSNNYPDNPSNPNNQTAFYLFKIFLK